MTNPLELHESNTQLRKRSGEVVVNSRLVSFLYELMRDHLPAGEVEKLVFNAKVPDVSYCNGYLAAYAVDLAVRLGDKPKLKKKRKK